MTALTFKPRVPLRPPNDATIGALIAEVTRARLKFPGNRFLLAALMEHMGELTGSLLDQAPRDELEKDALQVACMAIRILEEGDASFEELTDPEPFP